MPSESTRALGHPSEMNPTFGAAAIRLDGTSHDGTRRFQVFFSSPGAVFSLGGCALLGGLPNPGIPGNPGKVKPENMLRVWFRSCSCICRNTLRLCSMYAEIRLCIAGPWKFMNCFHTSSFDLVGSP